jgi:hypothetical protein
MVDTMAQRTLVDILTTTFAQRHWPPMRQQKMPE